MNHNNALSLQKAVQMFLDAKVLEKRSPHTIRSYRSTVESFIDLIGPECDITTVDPDDVMLWKLYLDDEGLAESTCLQRLVELRVFWHWVENNGLVAKSPMQLSISKPSLNPLTSRAVDPDDRLAMLAATEQTRYPERNFAILRLMVDTGVRARAIVNLRLGQLNLDRKRVVFLEKGGKKKPDYFTKRTADALRVWLAIRPDVEHDFVFTSERGGSPLSYAGLSRLCESLAKLAGATGPTNPHAFRHGVGRDWFNAGVAPTLVQAKLGHSDVLTTLRYYANQDEDQLKEMTDKLAP